MKVFEKMKKLLPVLAMVLLAMGLMLQSATSVQAATSISKAKPSMKYTASTTGTVKITWKKISGATGYQVYSCNSLGGSRKLVKTVNSVKTVSASVKDVYSGKSYYFRMRAYQKKGGKTYYSKWSSVLKINMAYSGPRSTIKKLLQTGLKPLGSTVYIWGGGHSWSDTGYGVEVNRIGVSPQWKKFFDKQTSSYDYNLTRYQTADGLDCSGYIGWTIYNTLNTKAGGKSYVMKSTDVAPTLAKYNWGSYTLSGKVTGFKAGDIMSTTGHVYMVVGQCKDGSIVLMHSSPPGVQLTGTTTKSGSKNSEAIKLATTYMKKYYPKWYAKFPENSRGSSYLKNYNQMRWNITGKMVMTDPEGLTKKDAAGVLKAIFNER